MTSFATLLETACQRPIVLTALRLALIVGTLLNLIDEGEQLLNAQPLSWFNVVANYLVPYCISSYSAARNELQRHGKEAP